MADGAHLAQVVGQRQQRRRAGEQPAAEIDPQPVAHHRLAKVVGDAGQLPDLLLGQELRLVDEDAGGAAAPGFDQGEKIGFGGETQRGFGDADAAGDLAGAGAVVQRRGQKQRRHAAFAIIVGRLQQERALAGIHRGIMKIKLGHAGR